MPSAAYFRRQADIFLRLSLIASDDATASRLVQMAHEYLATGEALEKQDRIDGPDVDGPPAMAEDAPPFNSSTDDGPAVVGS